MLLNKPIPLRYIIGKIKYDLAYVLILALTVFFVTEEYQHLLPDMPLPIPAFIGTAISILLSFKMSHSYERWWEARKIWGSIVNDSRTLVLQLHSLVASGNEQVINTIVLRQIAWCHALGRSLRKLDPLENLAELVMPEELEELNHHANKPLALLNLHGKDIKALRSNNQLDSFSHIQLDSTIVRLCAAQGQAERIKSTVFPVTYRIFLHAMIYLFVTTLSIALTDVEGLFEIPLLILVASAFFLLEKTATHMQDPFENRPTDIAVTTIANTIETNLRQLISQKEVKVIPQPDNYYVL